MQIFKKIASVWDSANFLNYKNTVVLPLGLVQLPHKLASP